MVHRFSGCRACFLPGVLGESGEYALPGLDIQSVSCRPLGGIGLMRYLAMAQEERGMEGNVRRLAG